MIVIAWLLTCGFSIPVGGVGDAEALYLFRMVNS